MMFAEDIARALTELRIKAEARMTSRATIRRKTGATVTDARGLEVPEWVDVATVACRIAGMTRGQSPSKTLDIGGAQVQVATRVAHFPVGTDIHDGDLIDVLAGDVAGAVYRVIEAGAADQQTARRVPVIATERPKEWS